MSAEPKNRAEICADSTKRRNHEFYYSGYDDRIPGALPYEIPCGAKRLVQFHQLGASIGGYDDHPAFLGEGACGYDGAGLFDDREVYGASAEPSCASRGGIDRQYRKLHL